MKIVYAAFFAALAAPGRAQSAWSSGYSRTGSETDILSSTIEVLSLAPSMTALPLTPSASSATPGATHTINVGASGHKFTPAETEAKVGDTIEFRFYPPEHWIIRGAFEQPCIPYEYVGVDRQGFSSGPQPVEAITDDAPRYRVRVNDTEPIFFYCGAEGSCVNYHMMGVVNPSSNMTLGAWLDKAKDVDYQLRPGDRFPSEGDDPKPSPDSGSSGLSGGAIAGIAIGAVAAVLLAALAGFCLMRRHRRRRRRAHPHQTAAPGSYEPDRGRQSFHTAASAIPMSPKSGMTQIWENKFGYDSAHASAHQHPSLADGGGAFPGHGSAPVSPGSLTTDSYQFPIADQQMPPPGSNGHLMVPNYDPRAAQYSQQYMAYAPIEAPAQERQRPVELPTPSHNDVPPPLPPKPQDSGRDGNGTGGS